MLFLFWISIQKVACRARIPSFFSSLPMPTFPLSEPTLSLLQSQHPLILCPVGVLFIFYYIFGVMGITLFGDVPGLAATLNFKNFLYAFPLLFTVSTTEGWNQVMEVCGSRRVCPRPVVVIQAAVLYLP